MSATFGDFENDSFESEEFFRQARLPERPAPYRPALYGAARLATEVDLATHLSGVDADVASFEDVSFLLEAENGNRLTALYRRPLFLSADTRQRGILVVGPPGSGKTERFLFPLAVSDVRDPGASLVLTCTKGDIEHRLRPFVEKYRPGAKIDVINFSDPARTTAAFNPYAESLDAGRALREAEDFCAAAASDRPGRNDSPFWDQNAARLIVALQLIGRKQHGEVCPADVHHAVELPQTQLLKLLAAHPDVNFAAGCHAFLASGAHNAETVLATAQGHLRRFCDERLAATTSVDEFCLETLFHEPTIVVLEIRQADLELVRPLVNGFFARLFSAACSFAEDQPGHRLPRPLCVHLDDFVAALGKVPRFASFANLLRSRDVRLTAAVQTLRQFTQAYDPGEDDAIITAFGTKIFLSGVDPSDARWASEQSGIMTIERAERSEEAGDERGEVLVHSRSVGPAARPLLLPDEIRLGPQHFLLGRAATVLLPDVPPFQAWFRPAFETPGLAELLNAVRRKPRHKQLRAIPLTYQARDASMPTESVSRQLPPFFTDPRNLSPSELTAKIIAIRNCVGWNETVGTSRKWWEAFENENSHRPGLVLRLLEELLLRKATITEFFLAYVYSDTDNIQANLHYLDYSRLKREAHRRSRETADPRVRFRTGDVCPPGRGGAYRIDGWLTYLDDDEELEAESDIEMDEWKIAIDTGELFPPCPHSSRVCYWIEDAPVSHR